MPCFLHPVNDSVFLEKNHIIIFLLCHVTELFKKRNLENSPWIIITELHGFLLFFLKAVIKYTNNNLTYLDIISLSTEMPLVLVSEPVIDLNYTNKFNAWGQRW